MKPTTIIFFFSAMKPPLLLYRTSGALLLELTLRLARVLAPVDLAAVAVDQRGRCRWPR